MQAAWQPPCRGSGTLPISPEGKMSLERQEELEALCEQLRQQVKEMEVRGVARAVCPAGTGSEPPPPAPWPHPAPAGSGFPPQD